MQSSATFCQPCSCQSLSLLSPFRTGKSSATQAVHPLYHMSLFGGYPKFSIQLNYSTAKSQALSADLSDYFNLVISSPLRSHICHKVSPAYQLDSYRTSREDHHAMISTQMGLSTTEKPRWQQVNAPAGSFWTIIVIFQLLSTMDSPPFGISYMSFRHCNSSSSCGWNCSLFSGVIGHHLRSRLLFFGFTLFQFLVNSDNKVVCL